MNIINLQSSKKAVLLFACIFISLISFAQVSKSDTLYVKSLYFYQNGKFVSFAKVKKMCAPFPETQSKIKTIKNYRIVSYPQSIITGLTFGFGLGELLFNNVNLNSVMLTSSGILCGINLRFQQSLQRNEMRKLAILYNQHLN
ncbi:MAG: hypothetical protein WCI53_06165 [Bacteroidota bacterium]|jgi:hypothetical protein